MDWLAGMATLVALLLLRIALPVGLTVLAGYLLARLDARWRLESERQARQVALARARARPPCWEQRGCDPDARTRCPAYARSPEPCWQVFRQTGGQLPERCFGCPVFLSA